MFQQTIQQKRSPLWKFLPIGVLVCVALAALGIYLSQQGASSPEELSGILRKGDPLFDAYAGNVHLLAPKIEMGLNFAGNRIVILSGTVSNMGDRTLDVLEVKAAFYNFETPVEEIVRVPIRPGPYTPPIQPLSERAFVFYVEKIPVGWGASEAELSIHGFRFR
jgi:hypothetical protein